MDLLARIKNYFSRKEINYLQEAKFTSTPHQDIYAYTNPKTGETSTVIVHEMNRERFEELKKIGEQYHAQSNN